MENITILIHTYNSEKDLPDAIRCALLLTANVIIVDMESTDSTVSIAQKLSAGTVSFPFHPYVEPSREFAINQTKTPWILILDSDERMTEKLAKEIKTTLRKTEYSYFKIPRRNIFGRKKWLKHGGWWPDQQIRLIKKSEFKRWSKEIHSTPIIGGRQGVLKEPILHYFHGNIEEMVKKTSLFEDIESDLLYKANRQVKTSTFFRKYIGEFFRRLFKKTGFMDGTIGIIESIYQAFSKTITYIFLYEKKKSRSI